MKKLKVLNNDELMSVNGGSDLWDAITYGIGWAAGVLTPTGTSGGTWNSFYGGVRYDDPCR